MDLIRLSGQEITYRTNYLKRSRARYCVQCQNTLKGRAIGKLRCVQREAKLLFENLNSCIMIGIVAEKLPMERD